MSNSITRLFNESILMADLSDRTITLIKSTSVVPAIKRLVTAYDILTLNLEIEKKFREFRDGPPWDIHALQDLGQIRRELVVYHRADFDPVFMLDTYSSRMGTLLRVVDLRLTNGKMFPDLELKVKS
jgi:hypothetical protein